MTVEVIFGNTHASIDSARALTVDVPFAHAEACAQPAEEFAFPSAGRVGRGVALAVCLRRYFANILERL